MRKRANYDFLDIDIWRNICSFISNTVQVHKQIQTCTVWSDNSITITVNQGSFDTLEGKYIFVVDADGNPSEGKLLGSATSGAPLVENQFHDVLSILLDGDRCVIKQNNYSPSMSSRNTLSIYDISSRLVEQLKENDGEFIWNTSTAHNAIYIMKLVGSQNYPGQKFVLIK